MFRWTCITVSGLAALLSVTFACPGRIEVSHKSTPNVKAEEPAAAEAVQERGKGPEILVAADGRKHKLHLVFETAFVAFGGDTNSMPPTVFGGKLFSEMDRTAAITARRLLYEARLPPHVGVVTRAVDGLQFDSPAQVRDLLYVTGSVTGVGEKSIAINVTVERENRTDPVLRTRVASGQFIMVTVDTERGTSFPHGLPKFGTLPEKAK